MTAHRLAVVAAATLAACTGQIPGATDGTTDAGEDAATATDASDPAIDASAGHGSGSGTGTGSGAGSGSAAPTPGEGAVQRADQWVTAKLQYCQSANHQHDYDTACSATCTRQDNAQWDPYRSDCSGLVSWAWKLPPPGRITTEFAPFRSDITHVIQATNLRPGDAVNNAEHIMLFKAWVTRPTVARFIEEPGCSSATPYAHEFTTTVSVHDTTITVYGSTYTAIRYPQAP